MKPLKGHLVGFGSVANPEWEDFDYSRASAEAAYDSDEETLGEPHYKKRLAISKLNREKAAQKRRIKELVKEVKQAKTHEEKMRLLKRYHDFHDRRTALDFSKIQEEKRKPTSGTDVDYFSLLLAIELVRFHYFNRKFIRSQIYNYSQELKEYRENPGKYDKDLVRNRRKVCKMQIQQKKDSLKGTDDRDMLAQALKGVRRKRDAANSPLPTLKFAAKEHYQR